MWHRLRILARRPALKSASARKDSAISAKPHNTDLIHSGGLHRQLAAAVRAEQLTMIPTPEIVR
jgi:hypothetical protein